MLIVTNYHYVRDRFDTPYAGIHGETPERFEAQIERLGRAGTFVSIDQVRDAVLGGTPLPRRAILVSFDDGLREQFDHAWPVLVRRGVPGVFFINTAPIADRVVSVVHKIHILRAHISPADFRDRLTAASAATGVDIARDVDLDAAQAHYQFDETAAAEVKYLLNFVLTRAARDRLIEWCFESAFPGREEEMSSALYMSVEQVSELGAHGCVGTHAHQHVPLGLLDEAEVRYQIVRSLDLLEAWTGRRPFALSYPYGSAEASSLAAGRVARSVGIDVAFTIERAANADLKTPLHLARFNCNNLPGGKAQVYPDERLFEDAPVATWF